MPASKLDSVYRRLLITRFFENGWGKPENLLRLFQFRKIISVRNTCYPLVPQDYPVEILKEERCADYTILEGKFLTPFELHLPGIVPKAAQNAHFQVVLPNKWNDHHKPMCIHLAGTGDHYFWRRRILIAKPLLKMANIGAIILENPFYGSRKPDNQVRSNLLNVSDIFVMGGCLILECLVLLHWCERNGFGPLGITGLSMGGHMASLAATNWPKPLVLVPCLSWSSAAPVFTTGVMSQSINWDMLETQYYSDGTYSERLSKMVTIIDDAFAAGQNFMKDFNRSLMALSKDIQNAKEAFTNNHYNPQYHQLGGNQSTLFLNNDNNNNSNIFSHNSNINTIIKEAIIDAKTKNLAAKQNLNNLMKESTLTRLLKYILPNKNIMQAHLFKSDISRSNWWENEALQFMRGIMDECTHLKNFSIPYDTSLVICVCAKDDAYVPREGCSSLEDIWPGVEVRYLDAGHVSAYVLHQKLFRSCIIEAFQRAKYLVDAKQKSGDSKQTVNLSYKELLKNYVNP